MMLDEGFLNHSPELALTFAKEELRVLANAILDVRLQMLNMTDQEALDLMEKQTFQEKEEATAKLQRAKLSSAPVAHVFRRLARLAQGPRRIQAGQRQRLQPGRVQRPGAERGRGPAAGAGAPVEVARPDEPNEASSLKRL